MTPTFFRTIWPSANDSCWRLSEQAAELERVLDETAASYAELQGDASGRARGTERLKRWIYGRRTEKMVEGEGQQHLFDLEPSQHDGDAARAEAGLVAPTSHGTSPSPRTRPRQAASLSARAWTCSEADKQCSGCGRAKDRIGQDESRDPGVRAGQARSPRPRATQVRLPVLQGRRGEPAAARAADCPRHRRTGTHRSDRRRQVRRPPAAVPTGRLLRAARPAHRPQHPVRLGARRPPSC